MNFNFNTDIILESNRLLLKPIAPIDIDNLLSIATADQSLLQFSPKQVYTQALLPDYINTAIALRNSKSILRAEWELLKRGLMTSEGTEILR